MSKIEVNEIDVQSGSTITVGSACKSVAVPGNVVKTNAVQASDAGNIISQSGTTITLGASGDTITLASGASQTGFGRTGTVDWQTSSIKTATFTAANGEGYFCNTTSGTFVVNLPAGSAGAIVSVQDYNNTFDTNPLKITPNGSELINGGIGSVNLETEGEGLTLVYVDGTVGWRSIQDSSFADVGSDFMSATGGTITTSGNDKIHTFTGPGTFTVTGVAGCAANNVVSHLVIAGGGGGGGANVGGGGGAGGFREVKSPATPYTASPLDGYPSAPNRVTVTAQAYPITVGGGGGANTNGSPATFSTITSAGGGDGGSGGTAGGNGGSGGGGGEISGGGGSGNTPPVSPPQGQNGAPTNTTRGGGGGGAGGTGTSGQSGGTGGSGSTTSINASPVTRAGGGGGGAYSVQQPSGGAGGSGGGGAGAPNQSTQGGNGTANTGGGAGGTGYTSGAGSAGTGGSGIVIIRYKFQ